MQPRTWCLQLLLSQTLSVPAKHLPVDIITADDQQHHGTLFSLIRTTAHLVTSRLPTTCSSCTSARTGCLTHLIHGGAYASRAVCSQCMSSLMKMASLILLAMHPLQESCHVLIMSHRFTAWSVALFHTVAHADRCRTKADYPASNLPQKLHADA